MKRLADDAGVTRHTNGSLPTGDKRNMRRLARALGFSLIDVRSSGPSIDSVARWLGRGRIAIFGLFNYPDRGTAIAHAVAGYRIWGDGTLDGTTVSFVDPFNGRYFNRTWAEFYDNLDAILADPHFIMTR